MLPQYTLFADAHVQAVGNLPQVAWAARCAQDNQKEPTLLVFDNRAGQVVDLDLRGDKAQISSANPGTLETVASSAPATVNTARGPGRPKLGVIAREVTLLHRHWSWLKAQSGSASAVLRRLVELEIKGSERGRSLKQGQARAHAFMGAMLANQPDYDEAMRALYAPDPDRFKLLIASWPTELSRHLLALAGPDLQPPAIETSPLS